MLIRQKINECVRLLHCSEEELRTYQVEKIEELLVYLISKSPFYQQRNIATTYNDFYKNNFTTKKELANANWDFLCVERSEIAEICATSGTSGAPVYIALTAQDLDRLACNELISFLRIHPGKVFQLMLTLDKLFMAGLAYHKGLQMLGGTVIRTGPGNTSSQLTSLMTLNVDTAVAVPSFLLKLKSAAKLQQIALSALPLRQVLCIGESILNKDLSPNTLASAITSDWKLELFSTYAATELQTAFTECLAHQGLHCNDTLLFFEIVDDAGNAVAVGMEGELVITTLGVSAMPLLRYRTGDITFEVVGKCSCGSNHRRIGPIITRKNQVLKIKGTTVYPVAVAECLLANAYQGLHLIEVHSNKHGLEEITIILDSAQASKLPWEEILSTYLRVKPLLVFKSMNEIIAQSGEAGLRKPQSFFDYRIIS